MPCVSCNITELIKQFQKGNRYIKYSNQIYYIAGWFYNKEYIQLKLYGNYPPPWKYYFIKLKNDCSIDVLI